MNEKLNDSLQTEEKERSRLMDERKTKPTKE